MGLHAIRQDASFDLIADFRIVLGEFDSMTGFILPYLEVNEFQEHRNAGIESDVDEHAEGMNGDNIPFHFASPRQARLKLVPFHLAHWIAGLHLAVFFEGLAPDD